MSLEDMISDLFDNTFGSASRTILERYVPGILQSKGVYLSDDIILLELFHASRKPRKAIVPGLIRRYCYEDCPTCRPAVAPVEKFNIQEGSIYGMFGLDSYEATLVVDMDEFIFRRKPWREYTTNSQRWTLHDRTYDLIGR